MSEARCHNCRFKGAMASYTLECRRHAPVGQPTRGDRGIFPTVSHQEWCGEWEADAELQQKWLMALPTNTPKP